eukprot:scaffold579_cov99-Skeletonema_menzelii.AAC.1
MVGYKDTTKESLEDLGHSVVLTDFQHYGPGETRTMEEFLEHIESFYYNNTTSARSSQLAIKSHSTSITTRNDDTNLSSGCSHNYRHIPYPTPHIFIH